MFIGRSMIVIWRFVIRVIIWIVSPTAIGEERDAQEVDQRRHARGPTLRRHQPVHEVDVDVPRAPGRRRDAHEHRADQEVARDLLGPRGRVVQRVAREELVEHAQPEQPEEAERDPVLDHVVRQLDRRVGDVELAIVAEHVLGRGRRRPWLRSCFLPVPRPANAAPVGAQATEPRARAGTASRACARSLDGDDLVVVGLGEAQRLRRRRLQHRVDEALAGRPRRPAGPSS